MNEQQIRQIVQQEIARNNQANRFNFTNTPRHQHTKNDVAPISNNDIVAGNSVEGSITFAQQTTYLIGVNFNPKSVFIHGNVVGTHGDERFIVVGNATFGPSFYLQPDTTTSVITGGTRQTIIQSTTYLGTDFAAIPHTVVDEGHIVDVTYGGTIYARATITGYNNKNMIVVVETLASGWQINLSFTIT